MLTNDQCADVKRSIHRLERELSDLRSAQRRAESRAEHNAFLADMRNNFRWVMAAIAMFAVTIILDVLAAILARG